MKAVDQKALESTLTYLKSTRDKYLGDGRLDLEDTFLLSFRLTIEEVKVMILAGELLGLMIKATEDTP